MARHHGPSESVNDFATDLKTLLNFVESYPDEEITPAILLQQFLTGLLPAIARQLLLKGKPTSLEKAVADARDIEFALAFQPLIDEQQELMLSIIKCHLSPLKHRSYSLFWNKWPCCVPHAYFIPYAYTRTV